MKTEKNILIAFILNIAFSIFEFIGGMLTGSVAILSDAVHDMGDAASIGAAYLLERKSKKQPDDAYTYGYARYSAIGSVITTLILLLGSGAVIGNAVMRLFCPAEVHYNGMIVFAIVGVCVNLVAALLTRDGGSLNQKAVNLHMLEDVLGWVVVLVGAIVMRFTDFYAIDPLMSIGVAVFIVIGAIKNLGAVLALFLEKTPRGVDIAALKSHVCEIDGVLGVHHVHVRSLDGQHHCATMHIVARGDAPRIKQSVREVLRAHGILHVTLELEESGEVCSEAQCRAELVPCRGHHHRHHHERRE